MKVMVIVKASKASEAGEMPSQELLEAMTSYNEQLVEAGIMLAGEGLHPTSEGKRMRFSGSKRTVIDLHRNQGADRRFLALEGRLDGAGDRMAEALPEPAR